MAATRVTSAGMHTFHAFAFVENLKLLDLAPHYPGAKRAKHELSVERSYGAGVMCPLPEGAVDIPQVITFMHETDFDGPVVVEQDVADNATETPLELARRNLNFLKRAA